MQEFRNPEFKYELYIYILVAVVFSIIGFIIKPIYGLLFIISGVIFAFIHLYFARKRYKKIASLSNSINRILHGQDTFLITDSVEGELSILNSEISKMTTRLKESSDLLLADKVRLTEAIADIFHQLRTPLTSMNIVVSMLSEENLVFERRLQYTREIKKQLQRIEWLVETLLKMSKIDSGTALFREETISVSELIKKASDPLAIPMELRGQTFNIVVGEETFNGDLLWTTEALGNILKNCMEHTPENGRIDIHISDTALYTEIIVHDSGEGFNEEDIPHLFERYYRGKDSNEGSIGIGLALSRMIIAAQNGTVTAANSADGGAQFIIRFYKSII